MSVVTGVAGNIPLIYWRVDLDDSEAVSPDQSGLKDLLTVQSTKHRMFNRPVSVYFRPVCHAEGAEASGTVKILMGRGKRSPWIDTVDNNFLYDGLKVMVYTPKVQGAAAENSFGFIIEKTLYCLHRNKL